MSNHKFILCTDGLYVEPDITAPSATLEQAFTGGLLFRRAVGVSATDACGIYGKYEVVTTNGDGNGEGDWEAVAWNSTPTGDPTDRPGIGSYNAVDDRWDGVQLGVGDTGHGVKILQTIAGELTRVRYEAEINVTDPAGLGSLGAQVAIDEASNAASLEQPVGTGVTVLTGDTGTISHFNPTVELRVASSDATDIPCYSRINWIEVTVNNVVIRYTSDAGDTISEWETGLGLSQYSAYDVDDYAEGCHVFASGVAIHATTSYTATSAAEIASLTGLDGEVGITCIRVPFLKLATQAANDDAASLQFIYGTDGAVSGKTLWGITFNASTGVVAAQSNMTPTVGATAYYPVGARALSTFGGNTQRIAGFFKPVGGGTTRLLTSINGGGDWTDKGALDGTALEFIAPADGGTGHQLIVSGATISIRYSGNFGQSFTDITGDLSAETGSAAAINGMAI